MKKRIGVIIYQTSTSKGQELVAERMVWYFRKLGHEAYLITSVYHDGVETLSENSLGDDGYLLIDDAQLHIPIIRVASTTSRWPPRRVLFKDSIYTLEKIVNEFKLNVLITHSTLWNGPEEVAKFVEWRRNVKEFGGYQDPVVFCHMSHFQEPSSSRYSLVERSFRLAWNRLSLKTILRVANLVLVVTPFEKESKVKLGADPNKCFLFPGGIDDQSFMRYEISARQDVYRTLGLDEELKIVAYLGTIEERKNPKAVLQVAERLKDRRDVRFVIAGRGHSEYGDSVKEWAARLPNVTYLGDIGDREKAQLIEISFLNILMSRMEALGLTQLEFMFRGVPVITSAVGGQSWIIRDERDGVHVEGPDDIDGASEAILSLLNDAERWHRLSVNAKKRAAEFTLTKLVKDLDSALTNELEKETGLSQLPAEVKATLVEPELVTATWSHGAHRVVATNQRVFIERGRLSRSTLEIPYSSVGSIEYVKHYSWGALVVGVFLSAFALTFSMSGQILVNSLTALLVLDPPNSLVLLTVGLAPVLIGSMIFARSLRRGYALQGPKTNAVFLPPQFRDAIQYIREMHDSPSLARLKLELKKARDRIEVEGSD
ncbi:MAG TPA: glycosyltransferase family 4 protein [Terriglobales bacterium]|nr:glycosyltransferase family 4 protein [Terriglobales bacterium]